MNMNLLNDNIKLGSLRLRVANLDLMIDYYTEVMGLSLISNENGLARLGIDDIVYLELKYEEGNELSNDAYVGLYHMAFVLPSESDLVAFILHLVKKDYPPQGAADHLFSQAIYFNDPENNGIEVYVDRPKNEWVYVENQHLKLASDPLDFEGMQNRYDQRGWRGMPQGAHLGHVHYTVSSMKKSKEFVENLLGMDTTIEIPSALFTSKGGYHHHFGMNIWTKVKDGPLPDKKTGLILSTIIVDNLDEIKEKILQYDGDYKISDHKVLIKDKQGLTFELIE